MYVLAASEAIVRNIGELDLTKDIFKEITPEYITQKRLEIRELIQKLI